MTPIGYLLAGAFWLLVFAVFALMAYDFLKYLFPDPPVPLNRLHHYLICLYKGHTKQDEHAVCLRCGHIKPPKS